MKKLGIILVLIGVATAGCTTLIRNANPWVFPGSHVTSVGTHDPTNERKMLVEIFDKIKNPEPPHPIDLFDTNSPLTRPFKADSSWSNEAQRTLQDPFFCQPSYLIAFDTTALGKDVDMFYDYTFFSRGWTKFRGILPYEVTDSGPDAISVYQKGNALIKLHIFGPWDHPIGNPEFIWTNCNYHLSLIGVKPEQLLGTNYKTANQSMEHTR